MAINKVEYGDRTLIDLTQDTVTPETLLEGETAHDKTGELIRGTHVPFSGQYDDLQGKPEVFPPSAHTQSANTITGGTFAGQVEAPSGGQNPGADCLRNSKLSNTGESPTVNGQVVIGYDGKPSSVMVGGTVYPIDEGGSLSVEKIVDQSVGGNETIGLKHSFDFYDLVVINSIINDQIGTEILMPLYIGARNLKVDIVVGGGRYNMSFIVDTGRTSIQMFSGIGTLLIVGIKL